MAETKTFISVLILIVTIRFAYSQGRYRNPVILRERHHCRELVVRELVNIADTLGPDARIIDTPRGRVIRPPPRGRGIQRPPRVRGIQRPPTGRVILRPPTGRVILRPPVGRVIPRPQTGPVILRPPAGRVILRPPIGRVIRQPPRAMVQQSPTLIPNPRERTIQGVLRKKRQTFNTGPPSRPIPPTEISLPDRGNGNPPSRIMVSATGLGSHSLNAEQEIIRANSVIPGPIKVPAIPNSPDNVMETEPYIMDGLSPRTLALRNTSTLKVPQIPAAKRPKDEIKKPRVRVMTPPVLRPPNRRQGQRIVSIQLRCLEAGRVCGWELDKSCRTPPCPTHPACLRPRGPANKPGNCPRFISEYLTETFSIRYCFDDSNCRGSQICCHGRTVNGGSACVNPVFPVPQRPGRNTRGT